MALSPTLSPPAPATHRALSSWRLAGAVLDALLWALFVALALHRSRFPVVLHRYSREYAALLALLLAAAIITAAAQLPRVSSALYARRHTLLWLLVFCPVLTFATVEGAMRVFNLLGSDFYSEIRRYMTVLVLDDRLFFKNPALFRGAYQHVEIATNELGLRERPVGPHAPGETRILVLGDSVAFGWGVDVEQAVPRQLQHALERSRSAAFETINAGVPGYNTSQELAFLQLYGDRLRPDLVVVLYVDNDIDAIDPARVHMGVLPNPWKDPRGASDYFLSMSRVYFMLRHLIPLATGPARATVAERRQAPGWRQSMQALAEIARTCRARGISLAAFHFRMMDDPLGRALNEDLEAQSRAERFYFADTLPWYNGRDIRRLTNSFIDTHPNAEGHRILADGMARFLVEHTAIGGE